MRLTYLDKFYSWMLEKGRFDKDSRFPTEPLSPTTAKNRVKKIRKILADLGYIKVIKSGYKNYEYDFQKGKNEGDIRKLSIVEIEKWFSKNFPQLRDVKDRQRKIDYVNAVYKFAEFLHYEMKYWTYGKLNRLKETVRRPYAPPVWENKVEILEPEKVDAFIRYIKKKSLIHYMMCYLMRYANMRYIEVINARADLNSGTLVQNFKENTIVVYGKGRGGLTQKRVVPFFEDDEMELKEYLRWREEKGINSEWLFVNQYGEKWSTQADHFNDWLRRAGKEFGFSDAECKLLTTHKIGRHVYGTVATQAGLPEQNIRENMGIRSEKILQRYQNVSIKNRVEATRQKLKPNGGGLPSRPHQTCPTPLDILKMRLASGEIAIEDYNRIKDLIL